jgi:hypothetical protein
MKSRPLDLSVEFLADALGLFVERQQDALREYVDGLF